MSCPSKYVLWDLDDAIEQAEENWGLTESQIEEMKNLDYTSVKLVDYWEENYKNIVEQNPNTSMQNPADLYTIKPSLENSFDFTNGPIQFRVSLKRNPNIYIDITRGFTKLQTNDEIEVVVDGDQIDVLVNGDSIDIKNNKPLLIADVIRIPIDVLRCMGAIIKSEYNKDGLEILTISMNGKRLGIDPCALPVKIDTKKLQKTK